jgi:hypothetical protein
MDAPDVTEFFIAVPTAEEAACLAARERLIDWMKDEFPHLSFVFAVPEVVFGPVEPRMQAVALPVMVAAINRRLLSFDLKGNRLA